MNKPRNYATSIESTWQPRTGLYHYRDRATGLSLAGKVLVKQKGAGTVTPKLKFEQPIRLLIEVQTQSPAAKRPQIRIHQFATQAADEVISERRLSMAQRRTSVHHAECVFEACQGFGARLE